MIALLVILSVMDVRNCSKSSVRWLCRYCCYFCLVFYSLPDGLSSKKIVTFEDLRPDIDVFSQSEVKSFGQLLFNIQRFQLIVGARDYIFRLSLEGLTNMDEAHWPSNQNEVETCSMKGKSPDDCRNYIKVLVSHGTKLFACGTNAFKPECSWREINNLRAKATYEDGEAKCPMDPQANSTALMTSNGDYYIASTIDFSGVDSVIYKIMGKPPFLRTVQFDPKWLNVANFVASYEIGNFTYYFFREGAAEYINCGKVIYSRVARICKNDQGGQHVLRNKFTTFFKARLNCSVPGNYPFYYNEIQSVYYVEREDIFYATFTTPINSIYGTAICAYKMSAIESSFTGDFKYQKTPKSTWERQESPHKHFECDTSPRNHDVDSEQYQLMNDAVQPMTAYPIYQLEFERLGHIVVDSVQTKHQDTVHIIFAASFEGVIRKLVVMPDSKKTCLIEEIHIFPPGSKDSIKVLKILKDTSSLYIGTEEAVLRVPLHRCKNYKTKRSCLEVKDPYCGWDEYKLQCTTAPNRNPRADNWIQEETACPRADMPVDGEWGSWSQWFECSQSGPNILGDRCLCKRRACNSPAPENGGRDCEGTAVAVSNCTRNGGWTEWSSWSSCSQTCGLAFKTRRRTCGNPAPAFGGKMCIGSEKEEIHCTSNPPCPVSSAVSRDGHWSAWSTWEECSAPCGGGIQIRRRRCNSPPPLHGGKDCIGCNQEFKLCNDIPCPEVKKLTPWTPYLRVNQTREGYFEQRFRFTCRASVPDDSYLRIGHVRKEERFCADGSRTCLDSAFVNIDGDWSAWTSWSPCSVSCGGGVQSRERSCDNPKPSGSGSDCPGPARANRVCNTEPCQDTEGWEEWSVWSLCDDNQEQHRKRKCKLPMSASTYCVGPTKEVRMCIQSQIGASTGEVRSSEDGIHAEHVIGAFTCGLIVGVLVASLGLYVYMKRKSKRRHPHISKQLIPVNPNTYVDENEWKNNFSGKVSPQKIPLREATIKRNGNLRAQLQSDNF